MRKEENHTHHHGAYSLERVGGVREGSLHSKVGSWLGGPIMPPKGQYCTCLRNQEREPQKEVGKDKKHELELIWNRRAGKGWTYEAVRQ